MKTDRLQKIMIACDQTDWVARRILHATAELCESACAVEYEWHTEGTCTVGRVEPRANVFPVFLYGSPELRLASFEGRDSCVQGGGIFVNSHLHGAAGKQFCQLKPRRYFRPVMIEGGNIAGFNRLVVVSSNRDYLIVPGILIRHVAVALRAAAADPLWAQESMFVHTTRLNTEHLTVDAEELAPQRATV